MGKNGWYRPESFPRPMVMNAANFMQRCKHIRPTTAAEAFALERAAATFARLVQGNVVIAAALPLG